MPSTEDNLPNVVLEAIGCGLPVVAFNQGGLPDLVLPNKTGLLATLRDTEDFAQAIIKVNANLTVLAQSCRKWAEEEISYEVIAAKHTALYQKLLR
jgi:glycosyltransferase involved in cell wall biosynthesis